MTTAGDNASVTQIFLYAPQSGKQVIATIKDVARAAGVSIATVSRVVNGNYTVSDELNARVRRVIEELGYQPNMVARGLRRQKTQSVGVLIPKVNDAFFGTFAYAVEKTLFAQEYRTFLCSTEERGEREADYVNILLQQQVDGVIMFPNAASHRSVELLLSADVPVVIVERDIPDIPVHRVLVTNRKGGYTGVAHLAELGHRDIGVVGSPVETTPMSVRFAGVVDAFEAFGIDAPPERIQTGASADSRYELGFRNTMTLLERGGCPTGIFALTDEIAIGVLEALSQQGIRVPDDVSVVGFDNILMTSFLTPKLTTVEQPIAQMGAMAGDILLRSLSEDDGALAEVTLDTSLVLRQSTAPPRA